MVERGTIEEPNISQEFEDSIGTSEQSARNLRPGQIGKGKSLPLKHRQRKQSL